ncbi:hypothetical protein [Actinoplanes sp. NPDC026670]|uniref:hypothetical protein n=1 Tax=Actinoplanes sp. NPDC026670 TaxID=3154700 RepID=UPI0033CECF74
MSGRKRILVDEAEYFGLEQKAKQLGGLQRAVPVLINQLRQQVNNDLVRVSEALETRQAAVEAQVGTLHEQARNLEARTEQKLREHTRRAAAALEQLGTDVRRDTEARLVAQQAAWRAEIDESRRQARREIQDVADRVGDLETTAAQTTRAATDWLADARTMVSLIEDLPHERHAPGELARITPRLDTAATDLAQGHAASALGLAQATYHDLSDLRLTVELAERENLLARTAATGALAYLTALIGQNEIAPVEDENGVPIHGVTLHVDHWSRGELTRLRDEVAARSREVADRVLSTADLRAVTATEVPGHEQRLGEIVERARLRQLRSQLRVNLAETVAGVLGDSTGYQVIDGTYVGADERERFLAKMQHLNGNELVVEVATPSEDSSAMVVSVHSYDDDTTARHDRDTRAQAIVEGLRQHGLASGGAQEAGDADPQWRDLEAVRKREITRE